MFMIVSVSNFWLYAPPVLLLTVGRYAITILVWTLFFYPAAASKTNYQGSEIIDLFRLLCIILHPTPWYLCLHFEPVCWKYWHNYILYQSYLFLTIHQSYYIYSPLWGFYSNYCLLKWVLQLLLLHWSLTEYNDRLRNKSSAWLD